ncbi:deoxyuridine 5'-triphosphate nucleotidohydrolase [Natranaeroarchaeum aerophilus]|uniref:Deoxyuridine 5'-triphosphate nucleotidohydrolase n=1 Tax=Natranaeroarchaeum aerophilus TaxID=2917711 RepID=A0AAE3FSR5_9EURY|nr:deoxyuridine 5'-triphosphate nucleotidohydrolase [Natranaeroarchaeum aerophilus]MCL9814248.1 deoxyuridine 5'-triphosphate nucleotidohydrolase [Natranaeroarchaeum aerophilus]
MFRSGTFVAEQLSSVTDEQIQPNGVDLTVANVFEQTEPGRIGRDGKSIGEREELAPSAETETYHLDPGHYIARYGETISIPEGHVGFVLPRSSLMRNSAMLHTAVWDAGYTGRGEGLLDVNHELELQQDARIAQLVLSRAEHVGSYDGSYQEENL